MAEKQGEQGNPIRSGTEFDVARNELQREAAENESK